MRRAARDASPVWGFGISVSTTVTATLDSSRSRSNGLRYLPWLVGGALFMENLDATIVNVAVPTMSENLGVAPLSLKAVLTSYTLSLAVFIPISGWAADRYGTRRIFGLAIFLFLLGSLFCGLSFNVPLLVASRILQGIGGAMMTPVGRLALVRAFPRSEMLTMMTYVIIPALIGPLVGPALGGMIVHWFHWRVIFFLNLPLGVFALFLAWKLMPDFHDENAPPLDRTGFVLFGAGIGLLSYVLEVFGEHTLEPSVVGALFAASVLLLFLYARHARGAKTPLLDVTLFKIRTFRLAVVGGFLTRLGFGGMPFLLPLLYQIGLGYSPLAAGLLTVPMALAAMGMKVMANRLLTKLGHRRILILNTLLLGCTISMFSQIGEGAPLAAILILSFFQGFFASLQFTCINTLVYADIDNAQASKASSIASTGQQMSLSFGVAFASMLAAYFLGGVDRSDRIATIGALHHAFIAMGVLTLLSSLTFWNLTNQDGASVSNHFEE
jgi:EmrB/QacA subfamily drug resistance transporter